MTAYVALLRAVNVGGTGKLPMAALVEICEAAGLKQVSTYIASGNVIFSSPWKERRIKALLEGGLAAYAGKLVSVMVRSSDEMAAVLAGNPFRDTPPNRSVAIFLDQRPPRDALATARGITFERLALGIREIYVAYGDRMATSKLVIPAAAAGTSRNMGTVSKLAAIASARQEQGQAQGHGHRPVKGTGQ